MHQSFLHDMPNLLLPFILRSVIARPPRSIVELAIKRSLFHFVDELMSSEKAAIAPRYFHRSSSSHRYFNIAVLTLKYFPLILTFAIDFDNLFWQVSQWNFFGILRNTKPKTLRLDIE